MKFIDVKDLKNKTSILLSALKKENVVLTKDGEPVALVQKFQDPNDSILSDSIVRELTQSDKNVASQYSAMMKVWGDPECDAYDEAFVDD